MYFVFYSSLMHSILAFSWFTKEALYPAPGTYRNVYVLNVKANGVCPVIIKHIHAVIIAQV